MNKVKLINFIGVLALQLSIAFSFTSCGGNINTVADPHFTEDGYLVVDSTEETGKYLECLPPTKMKVFVEVSGSMNGFFRANQATDFKTDLWEVLSYYRNLVEQVTMLTNDGNEGAIYPLDRFQNEMNAGRFVSTAETKVPTMIQTIISNFKPEEGEIAVLVSDMKYSPVGNPAMAPLMEQYATDISTIFGNHNLAVSLVAATSNYLDKKGEIVESASPYYYLIIGAPQCVTYMRNAVAVLLGDNMHYVDAFDAGFNYMDVPYSFGVCNEAFQLEDEPTFYGWDVSTDDTCTINLKLDISNYTWAMENVDTLRHSITAKALYGAEVRIGNITVNVNNKVDKLPQRKVEANVELKISGLLAEADVIEWYFTPATHVIRNMIQFCGATTEGDLKRSFSIEGFIKGLNYGSNLSTWVEKPHYILISENE